MNISDMNRKGNCEVGLSKTFMIKYVRPKYYLHMKFRLKLTFLLGLFKTPTYLTVLDFVPKIG